MTKHVNLLARLALSFLWIFTGITSLFFAIEIGYEVLAKGDIRGEWATASIYLGSGLDMAIGLWLLSGWRLKPCYLLQMVVIAVYTLLLSIVDFGYWLHPFGPLTKNLPLLVLIFILYTNDSKT